MADVYETTERLVDDMTADLAVEDAPGKGPDPADMAMTLLPVGLRFACAMAMM